MQDTVTIRELEEQIHSWGQMAAASSAASKYRDSFLSII